jgi:hypothetical protein
MCCTDFSEIETPILIKYAKAEAKNKRSVQFREKLKISKKEEYVFYCSHFQRIKCTHLNSYYVSQYSVFLRYACTKISAIGFSKLCLT